MWTRVELDFRVLVALKNKLFDSPYLDKNNCIPVQEFRRIRSEHDNGLIKAMIGGTEDAILKQICVSDTDLVDLNKFSDLTDLFVYMPQKEA